MVDAPLPLSNATGPRQNALDRGMSAIEQLRNLVGLPYRPRASLVDAERQGSEDRLTQLEQGSGQ